MIPSQSFQMSYDLNIYAAELPANPIPNWMQRLNACDHLAYDIHPNIKFDVGRSGFCPIKVTVPGRWPFSSRQDYMSGFEMSLRNFDFETYFDLKAGDAKIKRNQLRAEGLDLDLWESFRFQVFISFKPYNKFEASLSFLSAAILTEELGGVCCDPQTGQEIKKSDVFSWAENQVKQYDTDTQNQELITHPFEGWK